MAPLDKEGHVCEWGASSIVASLLVLTTQLLEGSLSQRHAGGLLPVLDGRLVVCCWFSPRGEAVPSHNVTMKHGSGWGLCPQPLHEGTGPINCTGGQTMGTRSCTRLHPVIEEQSYPALIYVICLMPIITKRVPRTGQ